MAVETLTHNINRRLSHSLLASGIKAFKISNVIISDRPLIYWQKYPPLCSCGEKEITLEEATGEHLGQDKIDRLPCKLTNTAAASGHCPGPSSEALGFSVKEI